MIKLLIVDDEVWVRQGLKLTIDWMLYGIQVVGEAENGIEAIQMIELHKPDIIISDIKMPCMDGLELIETLKMKGYPVKVIFVSGYSDFNYAQKAVKMGAFDYVLKPIEETLLLDVIQSCIQQIKKEKEEIYRLEQMSGCIRESLPLARQRFFETVLMQKASTAEVQVKWDALKVDLNQDQLTVAASIVHDWGTRGMTAKGAQLIRYALGNMAEEIFANGGWQGIACPLNNHEFVDLAVILSPVRDNNLVEKVDLQDLASEFIKAAEQYLGVTLSLGFGTMKPSNELFSSFREAFITGLNSFFKGFGVYKFNTEIAIKEQKSFVSFHSDWSNRLIQCYNFGDLEKLEAFLDKFIHYLRSLQGTVSAWIVRRELNVCLNSVYLKWRDMTNYSDAATGSEDIQFSLLRLQRCCLDQLKNIIISMLMESRTGQTQQIQQKRTIEVALDYIQQHFQNEITLNDVAGKLFLNPSYFSRVFHMEMEETFSKYLTRVRINKAKELLKQTPLKVYEIADSVGYKDFRHFVKTFKELEGVTPTKFRDYGVYPTGVGIL